MTSFYIIILVFSHYAVSSYNLTCPAQSQRRFRNDTFCTTPAEPHYICLLDVLNNVNVESCSDENFQTRRGTKKIRKPGVTDDNCTETRYQPLPFTTDEFSECMFRKSLCSEEGQVIANNGSSGYQDRSCRCDYRAGYTYIVEPRNKCECVPSEEDCSCYKKPCSHGEELSRDYECREIGAVYLTTCSIIIKEVKTNPDHQSLSIESMKITDSSSMSHTSGGIAAAALVITLVLLALLLVVLLIDVRPHVTEMNVNMDENHIIQRDDTKHVYHVIEGGTMSVDCKIRSRIRVKSVKMVKVSPWRERSNVVVRSVIHDRKRLDELSGIWRGESKQLSPTDTGEHRCILKSRLPLPLNNANTLTSILLRKQVPIYLTDFPPFSQETTNRITIDFHKIPSATEIEAIQGYSGESIEFTAAPESKRSLLSVHWVRVVQSCADLKLEPLPHNGTTTYLIKDITMRDSGDYICFMTTDDQTVQNLGFRFKVIPSESSFAKVKQHKEDDTYVQISAVDRAMEELSKHKIVVLGGREGTGKSKMCLEIASRCEDQHQYLPVMVTSKKDIKEEFDNSNVLYILDHSEVMDVNNFKALYKFILDRPMPSNAWTIISCRSLHGYCDELLLACDSVLLTEEKKKIFMQYMAKHNVCIAFSDDCNFRQKEILKNNDIQVTLDNVAVNHILTTEPLQGFPLMAKRFCEDRRMLHLGEKFFSNPPNETVDRIIEVRETAIREDDCELFLMFCLLIYLSTKRSINMKEIKAWYKTFIQLQLVLANTIFRFQSFKRYLKLPTEFGDSDKQKIQNAVNKMIGVYLKETLGIYEFIHPYMAKATFLSSQYFATHGLSDCPIEYILEFIRSCKYNNSEEEMVLKIDKEYKHVLCERLMREIAIHSEKENEEDRAKDKVSEEDKEKQKLSDADIAKEKLREEGIQDKKVSEEDKAKEKIKLREKQNKVCEYIYNEWVKLGDEEFCRNLFKHIDGVFCNRNEELYNIQAWHMLRLMHHVTSNGMDPWIYSIQDLPDMAVIFGLISACENRYNLNEQKRITFDKLLEIFESRLTSSKEDLKKRSQSSVNLTVNDKTALKLDQYGNTMFHYLCLYNEDEACQILEKCVQCMNKRCLKECLHMKNNNGIESIHLAVALGKSKFLEKIKSVIDNLMKDDKEGNILLKLILQFVNDVHIKRKDRKDLSAFDLNKNFDPEISRSVTQGSKEDFEQVLKLFPKKWLDEDLSKSIKK